MTQKLLFLISVMLTTFAGFSQVAANQPPDMIQCDNPVFDLTIQDAAILGSQNPAQHMVQYYLSQSDATMGIGHIWNAEGFSPNNVSTQIFARVTHTGNQQFAVASFWVHNMPQFEDMTVCDSYVVPPFPPGVSLHTMPEQQGSELQPGIIISTTTTIYVTAVNMVCEPAPSFTVTIFPTPSVLTPGDVTVCYTYVLPVLPLGSYFTEPNGGGSQLFPGDVIAYTSTIFVYVETGTVPNCTAEQSFYVTVLENSAPLVQDVSHCDSYVLPALAEGNYYSESGGLGTMYNAGDVITESMVMYVYVEDGTCQAENSFAITIGSPPINWLSPVTNCHASPTPFSVFNLENTATNAVNGQPGYVVTFHETQAGALNGINAIGTPQAYANTTPLPVTLHVRVESATNPECVGFTTVVLNTSTCNTNRILGNVQNGPNCQSTISAASMQVRRMLNGVETFAYTNYEGNYAFNQVANGNNVVSMTNVPQFTATPSSHNVSVSGNYGNYPDRDFCLAGTPAHDLSLNMYPLTVARPGMTATYLLVMNNLGSTTVDGTITLNFPTDLMSFVSPEQFVQSGSVLTHDFVSLNAYQSREFTLQFQVGVPPAVTGGEILPFSASVSTVLVDTNLNNNTHAFSQQVVNSYDPNDKVVVEGSSISQAQAGDYLNYIVRFQNTGTADALKVVIMDQLDLKLDWTTFRPVASSHDYLAEMNQNGLVSFTFDDINLPPEQNNAPASHGYIAFKVKPLETWNSDEILNTAYIYFDLNPPIMTNTVATSIESLDGPNAARGGFTFYPNPARDNIVISNLSSSLMRVSIMDLQGKVLAHHRDVPDFYELEISDLSAGLYLVRVEADGMTEVKKLVVRD